MTDATRSIVVSPPNRWVVVGALIGAVLGVGVAFVVQPVTAWIDSLVGVNLWPLELAAKLPLAAAIPVLGVVGAVGGAMVGGVRQEESASVTVGPTAIDVKRKKVRRHVERASLAAAYTDRGELVLADAHGMELLRMPMDGALRGRLDEALRQHGYPALGARDPHEDRYAPWADGTPDLAPAAHDALRRRARALEDEKTGRAANAADDLRALGVVVRDRDGEQEYRVVGSRDAAGDGTA